MPIQPLAPRSLTNFGRSLFRNRIQLTLVVGALMNSLAGMAHAAGPAPQSAEQQLLDVDGTLFIAAGLFFITWFLLSKLLWNPYLRVRAARSERIDGYQSAARKMDADSEARFAKIETDLAEVRRQGAQERARARAEGVKREQEIFAAAQTKTQSLLAESRAKVAQSVAAERAGLEKQAEELGKIAASRVLGRQVA